MFLSMLDSNSYNNIIENNIFILIFLLSSFISDVI